MKKIVWRKWQDPLRSLVYDKKTLSAEQSDPLSEEEQDAADSFITTQEKQRKPRKDEFNTGPVLVGETGVVPIFEHSIPSKLYNFWMGHTNFKIRSSHFKTLINSPGVESIRVYTPYRFRLGIGFAFNPSKVKRGIEKRLLTQKTQQKKCLAENLLLKRYPFCAKLTLKDDRIDMLCGHSLEEVEQKIKDYPVANVIKVIRLWNET